LKSVILYWYYLQNSKGMSLSTHIPGRPNSSEPEDLVQIAAKVKHPSVVRVGITTTKEGDWALLVVVKEGTRVPIREIDKICTYPIIYLEDDRMQTARPAYPGWGE
jgi:hypothetical protein